MKQINLFFEVEDLWEKELLGYYNPKLAIGLVLKELDNYKFKAVFFVSGKSAENFPKIIKQIHEEGHEIALHGYAHENFSQLNKDELNFVLKKSEEIIKNIINEKPTGIRSPLKATNKRIYYAFNSRKYKWASNDHSLFPESFKEPNNFSIMNNIKSSISYFNYRVYYYKKPYKKNNLLEIPLLSSYERDLLKMVSVFHNTPEQWIRFSINSLKKQYKRSRNYFNLNFHTWAIGTQNRIIILKKILDFIYDKKDKIFLPRDFI